MPGARGFSSLLLPGAAVNPSAVRAGAEDDSGSTQTFSRLWTLKHKPRLPSYDATILHLLKQVTGEEQVFKNE
jgi:hypothetical protein